MRLYFFPALVPIASLLPGVLAVASAVFAGTHALKRHWRKALIATLLSVLALGIGVAFRARTTPDRLILPQLGELERLPAQDTSGSWHQYLPRAPLSDLSFSPEHDLLLFGTRHATVDAISTKDGTLQFSLRMAEPVLAKPVLDGNRAFLGEGLHEATSARLVAIEIPGGHPIWQRAFSGHIESSPTLSADGEVLFGCAGDDGIFSLDSATGSIRWHLQTGHCDTSPLAVGDTLFSLIGTGSDRTELVALNAQTGDLLWKIDLPGQPWGTLMRDSKTGHLLTTTGRGQLETRIDASEEGWTHAIDPREKRVIWTRTLGGMPLLTGALIPGTSVVIFALKRGEVVALDTHTGDLLWKRTLSSPILSAPVISPQNSIISSLAFDGTLTQIDGLSGQTLDAWRISEESTSAPAIPGSRAFFATRGELWSFGVNQGRIVK